MKNNANKDLRANVRGAAKPGWAPAQRHRMMLLNLVALVLAMVTISACAKKDEATPIGRGNSAVVGQWAQTNGILMNGVVWSSSSNQSLFQDAVKGYVDATDSSDVLGFVSATASNQTGFYVGGKIQLQSGLLNPAASMAMINVRADSKAMTEIWDEYAGRTDSTGKFVEPLRRSFTAASGYVQGNRAYLKFKDSATESRGTIELEGTFSASMFIGTFRYDNAVSVSGSTPAAGLIGEFQVPTCQFFQCQ